MLERMSAVSWRKQPRLADCDVTRLSTSLKAVEPEVSRVCRPRLLLGQHLDERRRVGQVLAQLGGDGGDRIEGGRRVGQQLGELLLVGDELLGERRAGADERAQVARLPCQRGGELADELVEVVAGDGLQQTGGRGDDGADVGRHLVGRGRHIGAAVERRRRTTAARHQVDDLLAEVVGDLDRRLHVVGHRRAGVDAHGHLGGVLGQRRRGDGADGHAVQLDLEARVEARRVGELGGQRGRALRAGCRAGSRSRRRPARS